MSAAPIDFWFDFSSPYSYIASHWIEPLAVRHGRTVRWHAMLLGATFKAAELRPPSSYPVKGPYMLRDFARSARLEGVAFSMPDPFPIPTQNAARIFWWLESQDPARAAAWVRAGLAAYFARNVRLNDMTALKALAAEVGVDPDAAEAACGDERWKSKLIGVNENALRQGIFGAPTIVVDGEPFWGNDRRAQIERWLASGPF